jgi:hypothetical protein
MGLRWGTNEHYVGTTGGVTKCRAIMRRPADARWDATLVKGVKATPWNMNVSEEADDEEEEESAVIMRPLPQIIPVPEPETAQTELQCPDRRKS